MTHYTCDWCGMPMEQQQTILIDHEEYAMCKACRKEHLPTRSGEYKPCLSPLKQLERSKYTDLLQ